MKKLKEEELEFELSDEPGGLHSHRIFELIDLLSKKANEILALMLRWRKRKACEKVIQMLG